MAGVVVGAVVGAGARATVKTLTRYRALVSAATPPARLTPAALCMAFADALVPPPGSSPKKKKGAHTSDSAPTILQLWGTATVGAWVRGCVAWVGGCCVPVPPDHGMVQQPMQGVAHARQGGLHSPSTAARNAGSLFSAAAFTFATDVQVYEWFRHVFSGLVETLMQVRFLGIWANTRNGHAPHSLAAADDLNGLAFRYCFGS